MARDEKLESLVLNAAKFLVIQPRTANPDQDKIYTDLMKYVKAPK